MHAYLVGPPEEGPAAVAADPAVVEAVLVRGGVSADGAGVLHGGGAGAGAAAAAVVGSGHRRGHGRGCAERGRVLEYELFVG